MKTITVKSTGAHVLDLQYLDHQMVKFIGYRQDIKALAMVQLPETVTLDVTQARYRAYYLTHLLAGDLLPADAATAKWANLSFEGNTQ